MRPDQHECNAEGCSVAHEAAPDTVGWGEQGGEGKEFFSLEEIVASGLRRVEIEDELDLA